MRFIPLALVMVGCELVTGPYDTPGALEVFNHGCVGSRTDTLWRDVEDGALWVGCGEAAEGTGLYTSNDDGSTWAPVEGFETFRVSDVSRSSDQRLYVAGIEVGGPDRVRSIGAQGTEVVFSSQSRTWNSFHVGTFIRQANGFAIAESLTGSDLAFRPNDFGVWADGYPWVDSGGFQMLDVVDDDGLMVGVGSTIAQPPTVFVQIQGSSFQAITLDTFYTGELWSIAADEGRYAAAGVDQDADRGVIYTNVDDPRVSGNWFLYTLDDPEPTWIRDVCRRGDQVLAVGEFSRRAAGLARMSTDGGETFRPVALPDDTPALHNCWLERNGSFFVAGADGFFARSL